ncbi:hypothetical protein HDU79_006473 [Rhizoclosmatium sp. JEL0117]|nr:hypothetical protein HDU79_006473 [Rhizoclosmatium sp. JEL0117]
MPKAATATPTKRRTTRATKPSAERGKVFARNFGAGDGTSAVTEGDAADLVAYVAALEKLLKVGGNEDEDAADVKKALAKKLSSLMKWTNACVTASARLSYVHPMSTASFTEIFGEEKKQSLEPGDLDDKLGSWVRGSARYDDLYFQGPVKLVFDSVAEQLKITGKYGKTLKK